MGGAFRWRGGGRVEGEAGGGEERRIKWEGGTLPGRINKTSRGVHWM